MASGALAAQFGLRPAPFLLAAAYIVLGLGLSAVFVRETRGHARHESATHSGGHGGDLSTRQVFALASWREPALSSASQAGMVNNLNDGLAWGLFPILFATAGLSLPQIGAVSEVAHPAWRARAVGALLAGIIADLAGIRVAIWVVAALTAASGLLAGKTHVRDPSPSLTLNCPRFGLVARPTVPVRKDPHSACPPPSTPTRPPPAKPCTAEPSPS